MASTILVCNFNNKINFFSQILYYFKIIQFFTSNPLSKTSQYFDSITRTILFTRANSSTNWHQLKKEKWERVTTTLTQPNINVYVLGLTLIRVNEKEKFTLNVYNLSIYQSIYWKLIYNENFQLYLRKLTKFH